MGEIEHFLPLLAQREAEGTLTPLLTHGHVHFLWIQHANLYRILLPACLGHRCLSPTTLLPKWLELSGL